MEKELDNLKKGIDKGEDPNNKPDGNGNGDPIDGKNPESKYVFGYTNKHGCTKFISPSQIDLPIEMLMKEYPSKVITPSNNTTNNCDVLEAMKCSHEDHFYQDPLYLY